jgi:hypothetical protein
MFLIAQQSILRHCFFLLMWKPAISQLTRVSRKADLSVLRWYIVQRHGFLFSYDRAAWWL